MTLLRTLVFGVAATALLTACNDEETKAPTDKVSIQAADAASSASDAAATTGQTFTSETKTFREWTAVCDNVNNCAAYGPAEENGGYVMVKLKAGPDAKPTVHAGSWALETGANRLLLDIDGRNYAGKMDEVESESAILNIDRPSDQLINSIANGRSMTLSAGGQSSAVTLTGAAAAMLWIDERQGRLGTTTALVRKGTRPAADVPAAPAGPRVVAAAPVAQTNLPQTLPKSVAANASVRECVGLNNGSISREDQPSAAGRLGPDRLLWSIPCGSGAYNFSTTYLTSANDGSDVRVIEFPTSNSSQDSLVNSNFDPDTNTISAFGKGRGIGDCGQMASWAWNGQAFVLKEENIMTDCLGLHWEYWPSTWRTS